MLSNFLFFSEPSIIIAALSIRATLQESKNENDELKRIIAILTSSWEPKKEKLAQLKENRYFSISICHFLS